MSIPKSFSKRGHSITRHVTITRKYLKSIADRIEHGANIDDQDGATALTYTVSYKQKEMAEILI